MKHTLPLTEEDRQLVLMALAHLSVKHPGFDYALSQIALRIDNPTTTTPTPGSGPSQEGQEKEPRPEMYDQFRAMELRER